MSATCKYVVRSDGRESFITRQVWSRCLTADKSRPLEGHLVMVTKDNGSFEVIRVPQPHHGLLGDKNHWEVSEAMWAQLCKDKGYVWWSYLTPAAFPPEAPKKKRYTEAELALGHRYLRILVHDQEVWYTETNNHSR
jgi:hypothetical protein